MRGVLLAQVVLDGVIQPLKNYNALSIVFWGLRHEQSRVARILFQYRLSTSVAAFVNRRAALSSMVVLMLATVGSIPLLGQISGTYQVITKESHVEIHLFKGGFLSALGDNHLIALTRFSGTAHLSKSAPWTAEMSGYADSLKVIDPWGSSYERKEVENAMLGPEQLDVGRYPMIKLRSLSFDPTSNDTTWHLEADIKLHGVVRKETFLLDCHQNGSQLHITGKKMLKLTNFNIQPFSRAFGAVKVKNEFEVTYDIILDRIH